MFPQTAVGYPEMGNWIDPFFAGRPLSAVAENIVRVLAFRDHYDGVFVRITSQILVTRSHVFDQPVNKGVKVIPSLGGACPHE